MKKIILVVDDEFEVAQAVCSILEDEGFEVICCSNGLEAQDKLKDKIPHLVLSDIMMPRCNGLELLAAIKKNDVYKNIPVILMSAAALKETEVPPDHFIKKPFSLNLLLDTVEKFVSK